MFEENIIPMVVLDALCFPFLLLLIAMFATPIIGGIPFVSLCQTAGAQHQDRQTD
jgi:hypothetical protein